MEEEGIGVVLARATELRLKISNCVHKATACFASREADSVGGDDDDDDGEEAVNGTANAETEAEERLLSICDAFEALESQLSSLQMMQQNHRYEREAALAEIDYSRKMLLDKLKDYNGRDLDVIQEASAFTGDDAERDTNLLLPPYPSRPPLHLSNFSSPCRFVRNGVMSSGPVNESISHDDDDAQESRPRSSSSGAGFGHVVGAVTKTVITVVGIISVLRLYGLRPNRWRSSNGPLNDLGMLLGSIARKGGKPILHCPPERVLVMEDGEARCLVKERVKVPFESVVATPDVNYGCG